jgi:hypothetical protein
LVLLIENLSSLLILRIRGRMQPEKTHKVNTIFAIPAKL